MPKKTNKKKTEKTKKKIPRKELWIHKSPKILKSIREGIKDVEKGRTTRVKDLDKFLKEL